ncbi:MAG TPA: antibiotic biosynthesis monooxygenase family protein [Propionibacteriaceae bacterium]
MIVLNRFRVETSDEDAFVDQARAAVAVLGSRDGFVSVDFGRNLDEPTLWTITTRWTNVGSYRRALQGYESKVAVVPLLSRAIDEPSAYDDLEFVGENQARGSAAGL